MNISCMGELIPTSVGKLSLENFTTSYESGNVSSFNDLAIYKMKQTTIGIPIVRPLVYHLYYNLVNDGIFFKER